MVKDLNTADVCASFGQFVKFIMSVEKSEENSGVAVSRNAFVIMMCSQQSASQPSLSNPLMERMKKDKLFNDILQLVAKQGLILPWPTRIRQVLPEHCCVCSMVHRSASKYPY